MLAIALVLEGVDRARAAKSCGMDRQTLRDRVHRYNAEGLDGLVNRKAVHRPRRLVPEQLAELAGWVEAGPDPVRDGVVRWRRGALAAQGFAGPYRGGIRCGVSRAQRRQATGDLGVVPAAPGAPAAPEVGPRGASCVQKNFPEAVAAAIPARAKDKPLEVWFQDERPASASRAP
jgi:hypothetical protein